MSFILDIVVFTIAFWVASRLLPNIKMENGWVAIPAAVVYLVSYKILWWILKTVLVIGSLGLLSFLSFLIIPIAAVLAFGLTSKIVDGYKVEDTGSIVWGTIIVSVVAAFVKWLW
jgi:uncharacterized membrane protein YvlD (DUF360 family)